MTTEIAGMIETDDIPAFRFFQDYLDMLAWVVVGCAGLCLISCGCLYRKLGSSWRGLSFWAVMATCGVLTGGDAIWALTDRVNFEATKASSFLDWFRIMAFPVAGLLFLTMTGGRHWEAAERMRRDVPWRYPITFVFGASSAFLYALADHIAFWQPALNGGHHYGRFLLEGETTQTNLVLYSTSMLFASLVGLVAVSCRAGLRELCVNESGRLGRWCPAQGRLALMVTLLWASSLGWPWMLKLWPEIQREGVWILPFATTSYLIAILIGPISMASNLLARDELTKRQATGPDDGTSERAFLTATLFPLYPLIRWIPAKTPDRRRLLLLLLGVMSTALLTWLAHVGYELFSFEDWRGMLKKSQLPYLQVLCSALMAFGVYLGWKRFARWRRYDPVDIVKQKGLRRERLWGRRF
ncbi:MAG: hypothetical protein AAEJ57_01320, partial [Opitutales bacterium]